MITYKKVIVIEEHVTKIKVTGFNNFYSSCGRVNTPMTVEVTADGKKAVFKSSGKMYLSEIIDGIVKRLEE